MSATKTDFLEQLKAGPILGDGGYYLELERRVVGSRPEGIPRAVLDHPEGVLELHKEFARAGAEVLQAMTWGVRPIPEEAELHRVAVRLARQASNPGGYVSGTISYVVDSGLSVWDHLTDDEKLTAQRFFDKRVEHQAAAGVDFFILETFYSVEELSLALPFVKQAGLPAVATLTFRNVDVTRDGLAPADAAKALVDHGADVVGVNCMRPWHGYTDIVLAMRRAVSTPIAAQPTGYELEAGEKYHRILSSGAIDQGRAEARTVTRYYMAEYAREALGMGVSFIGACCGALPFHIRAMAEALGKPVGQPDLARGYRKETPQRGATVLPAVAPNGVAIAAGD
jgi:betaine-homocysteine S-methyltransferase